jgi:hypothetical protein
MDSRLPKDSNGILFVIFGVTDQKIWFLQDCDQIWFRFPFENLFEHRQATWLIVIGWYPFGWIVSVSRWILSGMCGWDRPMPVQLSDSV